jgi:hypothetical protein
MSVSDGMNTTGASETCSSAGPNAWKSVFCLTLLEVLSASALVN